MRKRQVVLLHIAQRAASPGAELPQLLLLARHPQPRTHLRRTEAGEGECPAGREGRKKGEVWWWRSKAVRGCGWTRHVAFRSQREPRAEEEARMSDAGPAEPLGHGAGGEG